MVTILNVALLLPVLLHFSQCCPLRHVIVVWCGIVHAGRARHECLLAACRETPAAIEMRFYYEVKCRNWSDTARRGDELPIIACWRPWPVT